LTSSKRQERKIQKTVFNVNKKQPEQLTQTDTHTNIERRRQKRVPLDILLHCQSAQTLIEGKAENISSSGILVRTEKTLSQDEEIELFFTVPGSTQGIQARGRVAHVVPGMFMGVEFVNLSPESTQQIEQYVAAQSVPEAG